ncbi:MAG TPA: hypothetical protein VE890_03490, partial [Thermoguttaceae bacterium]|nr:hypothetical protein [Thermoguttaceae bacterium]
LIATVFAPEQFDPLVDQVLGDLASQGTINSIKQFNVNRINVALSQIPYDFTIDSNLPVVDGFYHTTARTASLSGTANAAETGSVLVDGHVAQWSKLDGTWSIGDGGGNFVSDRLVRSGADVTYHVPTEGEDLLAWTDTTFDDSGWADSTIVDGAGMLITEISTGDSRMVEIENVAHQAIDTTGWTVLLNDPTGGVNGVATTDWTLSGSVDPGEVLYRTDDTQDVDNYIDGTIPWEVEGAGWAMVIDAAGNVMDFVAWGYSDVELAAMSVDYGAWTGIMLGSQWVGSGAAAGSAVGGDFVAFNDHVADTGTHANATSYGTNATASGTLLDIATGSPTSITLTTSDTAAVLDANSAPPAEGTDAYNIFNDYIDFSTGADTSIEIDADDNAEYLHTFTGLDTGDVITYDFAGTVIRGSGTYSDRWTLVTLVGADSAVPAHSTGAVVVSPTEVAIPAGQNHTAAQGFVAAWTDIDPGPDGTFAISSTQYEGEISQDPVVLADGNKSYALTAVRLAGTSPPQVLSVLKRTIDSDGNGAGDFVRTDTATPGTHNAELTVPFGQILPNTTGVGFSDNQASFEAAIQTDITDVMQDVNPSLWTRIEFVSGDTTQYDTLLLRMKYDDGFVAYLNGTEVARRNADNPPAHDVAASAARPNAQAVVYEDIDISQHLGALQSGNNVLAIHGLNVAADDADFLLDTELVASGGQAINGLMLRPGINRIAVQTFDGPNGTGNELQSDYVDIWCDTVVIPDDPGLSMIVRDSYLPGTPLLVRVEMLDEFGNVDRSQWDGTATLTVDQGGVQLSSADVTMYNGLGSTLVTPTGSGTFTLTAHLGGMSVTRTLSSLEGQPMTEVSGELLGTDTVFSGVVHVTGDLLVPAGHTLSIQPGTLVLIDGTDPSPSGIDIDVEGTIRSLGTALSPVTFTAFDSALAWGEIHHNDADPSLYEYTNIHRAGNSPRGGHTGTGPAIRPVGSEITFDHTTISDIDGKIMQSSAGSDLTFKDSHLARAVMGPEVSATALLFENNWITEMWGVNDNDGLYVHDQQAGQDVTLRGGVHAGFDDDALDTLGATVTVEDYILRDAFDKG